MAKQAAGRGVFRQLRYQEKKEALVRAAARAFGSSAAGVRGATIEEIAAEFKMTKNSLYYYFRTKEELLYEVHKLAIPDVMGEIDEILTRPVPPDEKFDLAIRAHLRGLATHYEGCQLLQQESELSCEHRSEIMAEWASYQRKLLQILEEGVASGAFALRDPEIALFVILGAINWFVRWYSSAGRLGVEDISDLFIDLFLHGMLAPQAGAKDDAHERISPTLQPRDDRPPAAAEPDRVSADGDLPRGRDGSGLAGAQAVLR